MYRKNNTSSKCHQHTNPDTLDETLDNAQTFCGCRDLMMINFGFSQFKSDNFDD